MPLALDKVHEFQQIPGTSEVRLVRTQPYVRITHGGDPPIFIQGGQFYYQGGTPVPTLPEWLTDEVAMLSDTVRAEVGLVLKDDKWVDAWTDEPKPTSKPPKARIRMEPWTCPLCGKMMALRGKTFHELHHKKQAAKGAQP